MMEHTTVHRGNIKTGLRTGLRTEQIQVLIVETKRETAYRKCSQQTKKCNISFRGVKVVRKP